MKFPLFSVAILFIINQLSYAQESAVGFECSYAKNRGAAKETIASPAEDNYDVKHVKFDLKLSNDTTYIDGAVTTTAMVVSPILASYVFELDNALTIDSALINGVPVTVSLASGGVRTATLVSPLPAGTLFTVRIVYHGYTRFSGAPFTSGFNTQTSPTWGTKITFSHSEPYDAKEWWPCKQSLRDKIDSVDMWVTVPDPLKAGSNGVLKAVTTIDATHKRYEWKERHPIDYYLVSVAVAPYVDYSYYMHFSGSTDSMLIQNYVYANPLTLPFFKNVIDSVGLLTDYFSGLYSRYPFWKEKYGHCMAPLNGGMENQTMTTLGFFEGWLVAHELGHQWFGDNVTCATWADIFVNEGFASYTEDIYLEHFNSRGGMVNDMMRKQANVRKYDTGSIYCADTTRKSRIFDNRLSYHKGACLLHMLRHVVNNDSTFFHIYKTYQQEFKGSNGTIMDFRNSVKSVVGYNCNGINIDTFFRQWAYGEGFPVFSAKWNQKGNDVYVQLGQMTMVPSSVSSFNTPVEIRLRSSTGDTVIRVNNDQPDQLFKFRWSKTMTSVDIDPNHWLLDSVSTISKDVALSVGQGLVSAVKIYPNPASTGWNIDGLTEHSTLTLTDITGRKLWQAETQDNMASVPANELSAGLYLLQIRSSDGIADTYKLIKE